jgi:hypothetical protein
VLISLLVVGLGWLSAHAMNQVDRDLRVLYTEYTLTATDLAHISADVMRYRATIIRALEAPTQGDFERITASLPHQRARIEQAVEQYAITSLRLVRDGGVETNVLQEVRDSLAAYFLAASRTEALLTQVWLARTPEEAAAFRHQAELHAADNAGPKLVRVSLALDQLLASVAEVAKDMRNEGSTAIRLISLTLIAGSLLLAWLNLFSQESAGSRNVAGPLTPESETRVAGMDYSGKKADSVTGIVSDGGKYIHDRG